MSNRYRWVSLGLASLFVAAACGGGTSGAGADGGGGGSEAYYTTVCEETTCDACSDDVSDKCRECNNLCRTSSDVSGCLGACSSLCATSCSACSRAPVCKSYRTTLPLPRLDREVYEACLAEVQACQPDLVTTAQAHCHQDARTLRHEVAEERRCAVANGCKPCGMPAAAGTLASEVCERQKACGSNCSVPLYNGDEHDLRPELVRGLRACVAEADCDKVSACLFAYRRLSAIRRYDDEDVGDVYAVDDSPETHADDSNWYAPCYSSSSCGSRLQCVKSCRTCDSYCAIPCHTHADCVGQFIGVDLAYYCRSVNDDYPGACGWN